MPHIKRTVDPVLVSRRPVDPAVRDELECMTNNTLANVIRELSTLSRHAEDMFRELTQETTNVFRRGTQLQRRIEDIQDKVTQLNPNVDVLNLQDIHLQKPFKSSVKREQQVLSRTTVPRAIIEVYEKCEAPPALDKLDKFREDGKASMTFYTDPDYFAKLWAEEMEKHIIENKQELKVRRRRKPHETKQRVPVRQAEAKTRERHRMMKDGIEFTEYQNPAELRMRAEARSEEMRRKKEREAEALYQQQVQQQHEQQMAEQRRQSQRQQQQQLQQQQYQRQQQQQQQQRHVPSQNYIDQQIPNYDPAQPAPYTQMPDDQIDGGVDQDFGYNHHPPPPPLFSGQQQRVSPDKIPNGAVGHRKAVVSPQNRPSAPPPAPPPMISPPGGGPRDSLPPPPSPPPIDMNVNAAPQMDRRQASASPQAGRVIRADSHRSSPIRQGSLASRADVDLPPPPPSPPLDGQLSFAHNTSAGSANLPPPPSPPPVMENSYPVPPPPPPPPPAPLPPMLGAPLQMPVLDNGDSVSISSASTSGPSVPEPGAPSVGPSRSDLMAEIRMVDKKKQLRVREAREEQRKTSVPTMPGALDVQALMDKAIEMRRKVIENSDSDGEESDYWDNSD